MLNLLIKNTTIIDGSGKKAFIGSVGTENGKITLLPADTTATAERVIDGTGLYTTPGFIDSHSHGDISLGREYSSLCKISQGITTQVTGMCGFSLFPVTEKNWELWRENCGLFLSQDDFPKEMPTFTSPKAYFDYADQLHFPENVRILMGLGAIHCAIMGDENREPTASELEKMKDYMRNAMEAGAGGLSSGLVYVPCIYEQPPAILELCKIVAEYNGVYATHMRDESTKSLTALEEAIDVARKTGVRVIISHHKLQGKACWGWSEKTLDMIDKANAEGLSISCDQYPYTACMSLITDCCPPWYYSNGLAGIVAYLKDPEKRAKIRKECYDPDGGYENFFLNSGGWEGVFISASEKLPEAQGKSIAQFAKEQGMDPFDAYCEIMIKNNAIGSAIYHTMCDEDLERIALSKYTGIGTDGLLRSRYDKAHPRAFGAFPHAICEFVKKRKLMSLEELVRKMTSFTAERYHIANKGLIQEGYDADLLVFDYDKLEDKATYLDPTLLCEGFKQVIVNGVVVYENQELTGANPGVLLRYHGK